MAATPTTRAAETNKNIVTKWLPVTTAYPSVQGCAEGIYSQASQGLALAWDPQFGKISPALQCHPAAVTNWWHQTDSFTRYSIGPLVCPEAYTTATKTDVGSGSTLVACCPSNYNYQNTMPDIRTLGECNSPLALGQNFTYQVLVSRGWTWTSTKVAVSTGSVYAVPINGYIFDQATITTSSTRTGTATEIATDPAAPPGVASSNLSVGAQAGIGLGAGLGLIGILVVIYVCFMTRRLKRRTQISMSDKYELRAELDGSHQQTMAEMNADSSKHVLLGVEGGNMEPIELDANSGSSHDGSMQNIPVRK